MSNIAEKFTFGSIVAVVAVAAISRYKVSAGEQSAAALNFILGLI